MLLRRVYCAVVGKDYVSTAVQTRFKSKKKHNTTAVGEDQISFEIGLIMGGSVFTGFCLYFLDPKRPVNTGENSLARAVWPNMASALEDSILDSEDPEATLTRLQQTNFTANRALFAAFVSFVVFRSTRRFWSSRWGELEWQRQVLYMPWTSTVSMFRFFFFFSFFAFFVSFKKRKYMK